MKILLSFLQDLDAAPHPIPAYRFWTYYIRNGIREAGMSYTEIPALDWAAGLVPYENDPALQTWKAEAWEQTLSYIKANLQHIDIFLCYLYPKQIDLQAIKSIRALGIPCVNFYCDNIRSFTKPPAEFKVFDLMWVPEYEALGMYQKAMVDYINLPMPMWVDPKYRNLPAEETNAFTFIGSKDHLRQQLLAHAISHNLPIQIRGSGWAESEEVNATPVAKKTSVFINQLNLLRGAGFNGFIAYHRNRYRQAAPANVPAENIFEKPNFEEYIKLTRESCVTLGINRVPAFHRFNKKLLTYSRLRDLEAPMLGASYLTEHTEGLPHLYHIGREIETYKNVDELVYKYKEIASSKTRRMELRKHGQQKALNAHSIPQSLHQIKTRLFG